MQYHKEKQGRVKGTNRSPRDLQRKGSGGDNQTLVADLVQQISNLQTELVTLKTARSVGEKKYTDDEFNEELIKQIMRETENLEKDWAQERDTLKKQISALKSQPKSVDSKEVDTLRNEIVKLKALLEAKQETIEVLKQKPAQTVVYKEGDPSPDNDINAPSMEGVVIDPTESDVSMESHIKVKADKGSNQNDKLSKLKKLGISGG